MQFSFSESSELKSLKKERKMYLDRSRAMYLRNVKLAKKIGEIKKILDEDPVRIPNQQTPDKQRKITNFFANQNQNVKSNAK